MLNGDKIILMTRLAAYENREGKRNNAVGSYFRGDYVSKKMIGSLISAAVTYMIGLALYLLYHMEELMEQIYTMDLVLFGKDILVKFLIFVVGYGLLSYVVYSVRYSRVKKRQKVYQHNLKKLANLYERKGDRGV